MKLTYSSFKDEDIFILTDYKCEPAQHLLQEEHLFKIIWSREKPVKLSVDGYEIQLNKDEVIFCTPLNVVEVPMENQGLLSFVFNKQFFCIQTNDEQVSCNGFLFFGSAQPQVVKLTKENLKQFKLMHELFVNDLEIKDHLQGEMLRSLLKRLLIISTRILKEDLPESMGKAQIDIIRSFNLLVEKKFRELHQVKEYASLLHKSPKTLSNLFSKHIQKSPLQVINERIVLEAKRLLLYSDKSNDEIAEEIGYKDAGNFLRFFKKHVGQTPKAFKRRKLSELQTS